MAIKPLGDRVLIEVVEEEVQKKGSLYIPDTAKEKPQQGKVIAVGEGKYENGSLVKLQVKEGDLVLYGKYAGTEIKHDGNEYLIVRESDILAKRSGITCATGDCFLCLGGSAWNLGREQLRHYQQRAA